MKRIAVVGIVFLCSWLLSVRVNAQEAQERVADINNASTRIALNMLVADFPTVLSAYDELIAGDPENASEYLFEKGICYYRMHQDSMSNACFQNGLTKPYTYAGNYLGLGLYMIKSNPDSAMQCFRKVVMALKDSLMYIRNSRDRYKDRVQILADSYHNMALIFMERRKGDSCLFYLFKAMDTSPVMDNHIMATSYYYYKYNHYERAYSYAKIALEMNRYEIRSAVLLGLSLEKEGKLTKAIAMVKEFIQAQEVALSSWKKGDGTLKTDMMNSYQILGYKDMLKVNAEFYVLLAYLHYKKNEKDFAAYAYQKAVKLNPDVFYNISNDGSFNAFVHDFMASKLRVPIAPKDYLPVYRNLFLKPGNVLSE